MPRRRAAPSQFGMAGIAGLGRPQSCLNELGSCTFVLTNAVSRLDLLVQAAVPAAGVPVRAESPSEARDDIAIAWRFERS